MKWVLFSFAFVATLSFAREYTYTIEGVPPQPEGCLGYAENIGIKFTELTDLPVNLALCVDEYAAGYNIAIHYESEKPARLVSTWTFSSTASHNGEFQTAKECEAVLSSRVSLFQVQTGLKPIVAFCAKADHSYSLPWGVRIETFGGPIKDHFVGGYLIFDPPIGLTTAEFRKGLEEGVQRLEGLMDSAVLRNTGVLGEVTVGYYSRQKIWMENRETSRVPSLEACGAQKAELIEGLKMTENPPALIYCGRHPLGLGFEVNVTQMGNASYKMFESSEGAKTFSECESLRPGLVDKYKKHMAKTFFASLCTAVEGKSGYRVRFLISK